jgi:tRNA A-37 threonylcarbamoyl transferase component Bud32
MKRWNVVSECRIPATASVFYILAKSREDAYQWSKIPKAREVSLCHSFYRFVYGTDSGYARTRARANRYPSLTTGTLSVLEDDGTYYIVLLDPHYDMEAAPVRLSTGEKVSLTTKQWQLVSPRAPNSRNRTIFMTNVISRMAVLSDYQDLKHEASGTNGEVFSMSRKGKPYVAKLQLLRTVDSRRSFEHEVAVQREFESRKLGLPLVDRQVVSLGSHTVGVTVMPYVTTLNKYLREKRTPAQLETVIVLLIKLLHQIQRAKLTHGDMALFNVYWAGSELKVMDFDLGSVDVYAPEVDVLRVATELSTSTRSAGGENVHPDNDKYLGTKGLALFKDAFGADHSLAGSKKAIDLEWERSFGVYCKKAHVRCLK